MVLQYMLVLFIVYMRWI